MGDFKPMRVKRFVDDDDINLIYFFVFCGSDTVQQNKPKLVFFSLQNYKSMSLQSARTEERLRLQQGKCINLGNPCKKLRTFFTLF